MALLAGHVFAVLFYFPEKLKTDPWTYLLDLGNGFASMGGLLGAWGGGYLFARLTQKSIAPTLAILSFAFGPALFLARLGCFAVHDHPGQASTFFLAVDYPGGPRHDLGLYGALLSLLLALLAFLNLNRAATRCDYPTLFILWIYCPARFLLDFLRIDSEQAAHLISVGWMAESELDRRYASLTPTQWTCLLLFLTGFRNFRSRTAKR